MKALFRLFGSSYGWYKGMPNSIPFFLFYGGQNSFSCFVMEYSIFPILKSNI